MYFYWNQSTGWVWHETWKDGRIQKLTNESTIEQVLRKGVLRIGMSTFVPWAMKDKKGEEFNAYIKINDEKGKLDFYKWNPDRAKSKGTEVKPDKNSETQVAVNSQGKTNEATKGVKEPLKKEQINPSERQQTTKRNRSKSHSM